MSITVLSPPHIQSMLVYMLLTEALRLNVNDGVLKENFGLSLPLDPSCPRRLMDDTN